MKMTKVFTKLGVTSPIAYGCMGLGGGWNNNPISDEDINQAHSIIDANLSLNINCFDHADIYTFGKAEQVFGEVLKQRPELKEQIVLQSKCGIRFEDEQGPKRYDFSKQWITQSVEGILSRLNVEHLPVLLLHRPDPLMEVRELAETLEQLRTDGKVGQFGVSNMSSAQMRHLQKELSQPLVANQLELSLSKLDWLEQTVMNNVGHQSAHSFVPGTLEYCSENDIQVQAWGCLSQGMFTGRDVSRESEAIQKTASLVKNMAKELNTTPEAVVLSWLMRHPVNMMPVIGTTNIDRIKACADATELSLTREQWYQLYESARGGELP